MSFRSFHRFRVLPQVALDLDKTDESTSSGRPGAQMNRTATSVSNGPARLPPLQRLRRIGARGAAGTRAGANRRRGCHLGELARVTVTVNAR